MDYEKLYEALVHRLDVVADQELRQADAAAHLTKLKAAAAQLDAEVAKLPDDADPNLRHYFERQSFLKAKAWLEDRLVK